MNSESPTPVEAASAGKAAPWHRGVQRLGMLFAVCIPLAGILLEIPLGDWEGGIYDRPSDAWLFCAAWALVPFALLAVAKILFGLVWWLIAGFGLVPSRPPRLGMLYPISNRMGAGLAAASALLAGGSIAIAFLDVQNHAETVRAFRTNVEASLQYIEAGQFDEASVQLPFPPCSPEAANRMRDTVTQKAVTQMAGSREQRRVEQELFAAGVESEHRRAQRLTQDFRLSRDEAVDHMFSGLGAERENTFLARPKAYPDRVCGSPEAEQSLQARRVGANAQTLRDYLRPYGAADKSCDAPHYRGTVSPMSDIDFLRWMDGGKLSVIQLYEWDHERVSRPWMLPFAESLLHGAGLSLDTLAVPPAAPDCILCQPLIELVEDSGQCATTKQLGSALLSESRKRGLPPKTKIFAQPSAPQVGAPFRVTTDPAGLHTYLKIEALDGGGVVFRAIVRAGEQVTASLPLGRYRLKYAAGQEWLGEDKLFGDATSFYLADDVFDLKMDGDEVSGVAVELRTRPGGNLRTNEINAALF